jgi:hypothetical protein
MKHKFYSAVITTCAICPHLRTVEHDPTSPLADRSPIAKVKCHLDPEKEIDNSFIMPVIPDWCPLPDIEKIEEEFAKRYMKRQEKQS